MKTTKSYKQPCPSCGVGVVIKDIKLVGKKVDCQECKFRFVAEAPKEAEEPKEKSKKKKPDGKDTKADSNGKKSKQKPEAETKDAGDDKGKKKKKKAAKFQLQLGSNKQQLGLALGAVGLVVLAVAAFLIMNNGSPPTPPPDDSTVQAPVQLPTENKIEEKKDAETEPEPAVPVIPPIMPPALAPAGSLLTNLLPNDLEHVARLFLKATMASVVGNAAKEAYPLNEADEDFRKRLGFPLSSVDTLLRADRFSAPAWSYTVVHLTEPVNESAVAKALDLQAEAPIKNRKYYTARASDPWIERLGRISAGPADAARNLPRAESRPLLVHVYDAQTIIFADKTPLLDLLNKDGRFPYAGEGKSDVGVGFNDMTYLTIRPDLKAIMDRMEKDAGETILLSSATAMDAARISLNNPDPRLAKRVLWQFRQFWDVGHLLENNRSRVKSLGAGVYQKDPQQYVLRNEIVCVDDLDANEIEKELQERAAPQLGAVIEKLMGRKIKLPELTKEPEMPLIPPVVVPPEEQPKEETKRSEIRLVRTKDSVDFQLDLVLDQTDYGRLYSITTLMLSGVRSELQMAMRQIQRDRLAIAGFNLGEKGMTSRQTEPGRFPPGAFKRPPSTVRTTTLPNQRVSWMAGLLPFLGNDPLFRRIDLNNSWHEPANWMAARTLVPEFLDPQYPDNTHYATHPNLNFRAAATHYVGIAGVGLDASTYADDPAYLHKRGVLGYERSASLDEVRAGHGLSSTVLMMQVPYDGPAGVTPWIAGGGATLRGVPEKNSIEPFVLGRDRDGKPMLHNGKRGAFALMTDGSVRFIDQGISDEVFKTMCTVQGPVPADFELSLQASTLIVNAPPKMAAPPQKK